MKVDKYINLIIFLLADLFYASFPSPPNFSGVEVVSNHEKIELIWNMDAENSIDSITGYADFEGYRIYRSIDGGITWGDGESDKIYDYNQNFVGWKPYAQFDLISELDSTHCVFSSEYYDINTNPCIIRGLNVQGYDPMAEWINIGDNVGISRSFIDEDVLDGVEYTYAVTAYDMGMLSFDLSYTSQDPDGLTNNYCEGDDSYCDGMACCQANNCCDQTLFGTPLTSESLCEGQGGIWFPTLYPDENSCNEAGYIWQNIVKDLFLEEYYRPDSLGYYSDCENVGFEWNVVEYENEEDCESFGHTWNIIQFEIDTTWSSWNPDKFMGYNYGTGNNELWGYPSFESSRIFESFTDLNLNGICDFDIYSDEYEPFFDMDSSDTGIIGRCDKLDDLTSRCPLDNSDCINVIVVEPGYKSSNYTEPSYFPEQEFIKPDSTLNSPLTDKKILNRGNGDRFYKVVNEYDLSGSLLRFEINADLDLDTYGDENGSFPTLNPSLFIYEINNDLSPKNFSQYAIDQFDADSLQYIKELPGVTVDSSLDLVSIPEYKVEDFNLLGVDHPQSSVQFTDWFDGIQFRFDNGPTDFTNQLQLVELKSVDYSDTLLSLYMDASMRYKDKKDLLKNLMYRYRIEFGSTFIDTAYQTTGNGCDENILSDGSTLNSQLPFRVININTGEQVKLAHRDGGRQIGQITFGELRSGSCDGCQQPNQCVQGKCVPLIGFKNCQWENNEVVEIIDSVYTSNAPANTGSCIVISNGNSDVYKCEEKVFELKFGFYTYPYYLMYIQDFFQMEGTPFWCLNDDDGICVPLDKDYEPGGVVIFEDMIYIATEIIEDEVYNPADWYDENGDGISDNPWQIHYPWNDGDFVTIEPYGWYQDGDAWVADLSQIGKRDADSSDDLELISVVPNPYMVDSGYFNESVGNNKLQFTHLPDECSINIYTVSGELITSFKHNDPYNGSEWWGLINDHGEIVAPGLYIFVVQTPSGDKKIGKFAVVR